MAIANPLVITLGGSGGTAKSLTRINQDAYGSEYYLKEATQEFRVRIRHSRESAQRDGTVFERHNMELTHTTFGVAPAPDVTRQVYCVLRNTKQDPVAKSTDIGTALSFFMDSTHWADLYGWIN